MAAKKKKTCDNADNNSWFCCRSRFLLNISVQAVRTYIFHQHFLSLDWITKRISIHCSVSALDYTLFTNMWRQYTFNGTACVSDGNSKRNHSIHTCRVNCFCGIFEYERMINEKNDIHTVQRVVITSNWVEHTNSELHVRHVLF